MEAKKWEDIDLAQAILNNPELPMGKAIAKAAWPIAFEAGEKAGMRKVVEKLKKLGTLYIGEPPVEGKPYQFLACYITKFGKPETEATIALIYLDECEEWQEFKKEWLK